MVIIFSDYLIFYLFHLPQVKQSVAISYDNGIDEFPDNFRLSILEIRKHQENHITPWNYSLVQSPLPKMKISSMFAKSY